ncbi:MAG TPA: hypothetical protein VNZ44_14930 [Pyrinomonadaceae bacterium]|nr:hypothetical protein [Pyrinomonadaceae bacterium]
MDNDSAVDNDSRAGARARRAEAGDGLLFPADGNFSRVVPLSQSGDEVVPVSEAGDEVAPIAEADDEPAPSGEAAPPVAAVARGGTDEREDEVATLVPARTGRGTSPVLASRPKKQFRQSWGLTAVVLAVSILAGATAGAYIISSQSASETRRPDASNVEAAAAPGDEAAANRGAEKVVATQPAEQPVPQVPAPRAEHDKLAADAAAPPSAPDAAGADAKAESVNPPAPPTRAAARASDTAARRTVEPEPRAERHERAASEARDASAPRLTPADAAPRRADRPAPASVARERSFPISSPPPSARPKKVIQWP